MALLGEMTLQQGKIVMSKNTSRIGENGYLHAMSCAAHSMWLRHRSIKGHILFGYPFDEERVNAVVVCSALKPDLEILEDGDVTEIGARGVQSTVSGNQKARYEFAGFLGVFISDIFLFPGLLSLTQSMLA